MTNFTNEVQSIINERVQEHNDMLFVNVTLDSEGIYNEYTVNKLGYYNVKIKALVNQIDTNKHDEYQVKRVCMDTGKTTYKKTIKTLKGLNSYLQQMVDKLYTY